MIGIPIKNITSKGITINSTPANPISSEMLANNKDSPTTIGIGKQNHRIQLIPKATKDRQYNISIIHPFFSDIMCFEK